MSPSAFGRRRAMVGLWLAVVLLALSVCPAWAAAQDPSAAEGEAIFADKCAGCHSVGGGRLVGPDLKGVTAQRDREWLARFIAEPDKVLAEGDPVATALLQEYNNLSMPNLGLSGEQVAAVVAYLEAQGGTAGEAPPPTAPPLGLPTGDPDNGGALFRGDVHFEADGPPCMGCHGLAAAAGALGGGVLGPNLTQAFASYGGPGMAVALSNIPWPTMRPIFADHPLTPQEQADLWAFMQATSGQARVNYEAPFLVLSLAVFFVAMIAIGLARRVPRVRSLLKGEVNDA